MDKRIINCWEAIELIRKTILDIMKSPGFGKANPGDLYLDITEKTTGSRCSTCFDVQTKSLMIGYISVFIASKRHCECSTIQDQPLCQFSG